MAILREVGAAKGWFGGENNCWWSGGDEDPITERSSPERRVEKKRYQKHAHGSAQEKHFTKNIDRVKVIDWLSQVFINSGAQCRKSYKSALSQSSSLVDLEVLW